MDIYGSIVLLSTRFRKLLWITRLPAWIVGFRAANPGSSQELYSAVVASGIARLRSADSFEFLSTAAICPDAVCLAGVDVQLRTRAQWAQKTV